MEAKKQLYKIRYSDAFGESFFIMEVWDAQSLKQQAYNYLGTNIKFLDKAKKAKIKDIENAKHRGEFIRYYVIPVEVDNFNRKLADILKKSGYDFDYPITESHILSLMQQAYKLGSNTTK